MLTDGAFMPNRVLPVRNVQKSANRRMAVKSLGRGFQSAGLAELARRDCMSQFGRYDDLNGPDIVETLNSLDWTFAAQPVSVGLVDVKHGVVAYGFASPIRMRRKPSKHQQFDAINLSYAVSSDFAGSGLGRAVASLAICEADWLWGIKLKGAFLNIQTRKANAPSVKLIKRLTNQDLTPGAAFSTVLGSGDTIEYVGGRSDWRSAVERAELHLLSLDFLHEHQAEPSECGLVDCGAYESGGGCPAPL